MNDSLLVEQKNSIRALLPQMDDGEVDRLAEALPMNAVGVVSPPSTGLIMATVRDAFETDFYLGEILVTRTEVEYAGYRAQATIIGDHPKASLVTAVLEAVCLSGEADIVEAAAMACRSARRRIRAVNELEAQLVAATRVNFNSMAQES